MINSRYRHLIILLCFISLVLTSCARIPSTITIPPAERARDIPDSYLRCNVYHEVAPAETIWRISKTYDVSAKSILSANNIKDATQIEAGRILFIPQAYPRKTVIPLFKTCKWEYIIIHHSATDYGSSFFFDKLHHVRGFERGVGYNFVIGNGTRNKKDGQIEVTPRWIKQIDGAHCKASSMNKRGIGVCLVGDFTNDIPTEKQMDSLVKLVNILRKYYDIPLGNILGHGQVKGAATQCPGNVFPWTAFKQRLKREAYVDIKQEGEPLQVIYVND